MRVVLRYLLLTVVGRCEQKRPLVGLGVLVYSCHKLFLLIIAISEKDPLELVLADAVTVFEGCLTLAVVKYLVFIVLSRNKILIKKK